MNADQYANEMATILNACGAQFLQVRTDLSRYLRGDGSAVNILAFMLNLLRMKNASQRDRVRLIADDLWFRCPAMKIDDELGTGKDRRMRCLIILKKCGLIEMERRHGNFLWVKVNTQKMEAVQERCSAPGTVGPATVGGLKSSRTPRQMSAKPQSGKRQSQMSAKPQSGKRQSRNPESGKAGFSIDKNLSENLSDSSSVADRDRQTDTPQTPLTGHVRNSDTPGSRLANLLLSGITRMNKLQRRADIKSWSREFDAFIMEVVKQSTCTIRQAEQRVTSAIEFHLKHIRDPYQPRAYSAKTFCDKFSSIEDAMERYETRPSNGSRDVWAGDDYDQYELPPEERF